MEPRCSRCVDCPILSSCGTVYVSNPIETNSKQISSTMWVCVCAVCYLFDRSPVPLLAAHPRCRFCHCHSNSQLRVSVDSMD